MPIIENKNTIKRMLAALFFSLAFFTSAFANAENHSGDDAQSILITYKDRGIDRSAIVDRYRVRSIYASTSWAERVASKISSQYHLKLQTQWPISELGIHCVVYQIPANKSVDSVLAQLRKNKYVETAQPMQTFRTMANQAYDDAYFNLQTHLRLMQIQAAHKLTTGKQVKIVIIDTGIDKQHQDLVGQVVKDDDYSKILATYSSTKPTALYQGDAHGTAVAGVISALSGNGVGIVGVAPDAQLISLKACAATEDYSLSAVCNSLTLAQALNQAIRLRPKIINMSLGGPADPLLHRLINRALDEGIIIVAAASVLDEHNVSFPASMQGVIAVSDRPMQRVNALVAPGMDILSTVPRNTYKYVSGSSISTATISGLIALMLELNPEMSSLDAVSALKQASTISGKQNKALMSINACRMVMSLQAVGQNTANSCVNVEDEGGAV